MSDPAELSFFARLWMAFICFFQILLQPAFARQVLPAYTALREGKALPASTGPERIQEPALVPVAEPPEKAHASGLFVLSMLQREGRLIDFLQEEVAPFSDAEVGAAARVVHEGCRKVVRQYLELSAVLPQSEGDAVIVPPGFDAGRIRLTGNVAGQPPFKCSLKHHGWVAGAVKLPSVPTAIDPRVLAPAEVELG